MGLLSRMGRAATELSKYYYPFTWRNKPSIESPINEVHLNHIEDGINEMDNRILILAQDKADATDIANVFVDFAMDDTTGVMTFTRFDGSKVEHDSAVEKIALNCYLEDDNFVLELADGTKQKVSLSKFIDTYTFSSTDTIRMTVNGKNVSAEIPDGKITLAKLEPTIMSTIRQYTLDAQTAQGVAEQAAGTAQGWAIGGTGFEDNNAKHYASRSQRYAVGGVEEGDTKDNAKYYCQKAQAAAEQAAGSAAYDGTATSVKATDTQGLVVSAGGDSNTQVLLDVLARKVAQELVSDSGLATKLADYVKKTDIVQTESTATDKVPSSAYLKQALGTINSNFAAERYTGNIDGLFKNCVVQLFSSLGTTGTFPESDINGSFLHVVNNGSDFCFQQLNIITNKNTTSYKRSWYYGNDTVYPGWSDWRKVITNSDLPILTVRTGTRYWTQYTEVSGQKRIYFYNADFPSGNNLLGYIALTK